VGEHKGDSPEEKNPGIPSTSENSNAEASGDAWVVNFILVFTLVSFSLFLTGTYTRFLIPAGVVTFLVGLLLAIRYTGSIPNAEASGDGWVVNFILVFTLVSALVLYFWLWLMRASCCA
tara:strand:+ start:389 stop:745 length:357 start_codon:yes stop_codon:yes gene_type:complete